MPTVCTLTGKFVDGTGLARTGRVTFVPTVRGVSSADDLILSLGTVVRVLDASGSFSVDLYRTDDASWAPSGWVWTVLEDMTGATGVTYAIELTSETANLADLSPVVVPDPYVSYVLQTTYDARTPADIGAPSDAQFDAHLADTTAVHGITDTSALVVTTDSRLTDARTPTAHAASHADGQADEITPSAIGAATAADLTSEENARIAADAASVVAADATYLASGGTFDPLLVAYGAVADWDGSTGTDASAAIQSAANDARDNDGTLRIRTGDYRIVTGILIQCAVDAEEGARFFVDGAPVGITVGTSSVSCDTKTINFPKILQANVDYTVDPGVLGTSIGIKIVAADACVFNVPQIKQFSFGLDIGSDSQGVSYNTFFLGSLSSNAVNLSFRPETSGWANQNTFIGGRYGAAYASSPQTGFRQIYLKAATNTPNANVFLNPSLEGTGPEWHIDCSGIDNMFINPRLEVTDGNATVRWNDTAQGNVIEGGYDAEQLDVTSSGTATRNSVKAARQWLSEMASPDAVWVIRNMSSSTAGIAFLPTTGGDVWNDDPQEDYTLHIADNSTRMKNASDDHARLSFTHALGRMYFGTGSVAASTYLNHDGTGVVVNDGNLNFSPDNTHNLGTASKRPKIIYAGTGVISSGYVRSGSSVTGSRITASSAGVGGRWYDTTLGIPIWSNGTVWKDAAGNTV
jgi:hypothetical protein